MDETGDDQRTLHDSPHRLSPGEESDDGGIGRPPLHVYDRTRFIIERVRATVAHERLITSRFG
jgi:hypothetical protein